jgi:hypothetical protein
MAYPVLPVSMLFYPLLDFIWEDYGLASPYLALDTIPTKSSRSLS